MYVTSKALYIYRTSPYDGKTNGQTKKTLVAYFSGKSSKHISKTYFVIFILIKNNMMDDLVNL